MNLYSWIRGLIRDVENICWLSTVELDISLGHGLLLSAYTGFMENYYTIRANNSQN